MRKLDMMMRKWHWFMVEEKSTIILDLELLFLKKYWMLMEVTNMLLDFTNSWKQSIKLLPNFNTDIILYPIIFYINFITIRKIYIFIFFIFSFFPLFCRILPLCLLVIILQYDCKPNDWIIFYFISQSFSLFLNINITQFFTE